MCQIKICGLSQPADIVAVNAVRPDYIGFVFAPSKRNVTIQVASKLRDALAPGILPVGVFVNENPATIVTLVQQQIIDLVQLHGQEFEDYLQRLREQISVPIIKAISVTSQEELARQAATTTADYLLLDHGKGGTGQAFDWNVIDQVDRPFFLAGGLSIDNVSQAIDSVHPFAVDVSSGVETNGRKDPEKIQHFVRRVKHGG